MPEKPDEAQPTRPWDQETTARGLSDAHSRWADSTVLTLAIFFPALITWVYFIVLAAREPGLQQVAYGLGKSLQFILPVVWVAVFRPERLRFHRPRKAGLLEGLAFGLAIFAAALLLYHLWLKPAGYLAPAAHTVREKIAAFQIDSPWRYVAMGVFYCVIHSFLEEYYWRWFVFAELRRLVPVAAAIAISALGFTLHHILVLSFYFGWLSVATWLFTGAVAVGGAFWAWLYHRSGSLYGPWISHLLIDAAIFVVGYDLVRASLTG